MFRWFCFFCVYVIEEMGLMFYCIWCYCLKYWVIGMNFDVYDWKVVMLCIFLNGSLICIFFREDVLEFFIIFIYLYFFMYFMGVSIGKEFYFFFFKWFSSRCNFVIFFFFSCGLISLRLFLWSKGNFLFD